MTEFLEWLGTLDTEFLFLLALPFAIAALGLAAEALPRANRARGARSAPKAAGTHARDSLHPSR